MKKIIIFLAVTTILFVFASQCVSTSQNTASQNINSQTQSPPSCVRVHCVPKSNNPGKPSCTEEKILDYTNTICNHPSAPIIGNWEGYGNQQPLSNARFIINEDHTIQMTGLPLIGSANVNWYRCNDELECPPDIMGKKYDNNYYIVLGQVLNTQVFYYDAKGDSINFEGNKLVRQ